MDAKSPATENRDPCRFSAALSSALSEWILIVLLLVDSFFLYLAKKICRSCKLQTPCLLCTRFGHLLGNEKLGFYRDLVCDVHKLEISSLAFCHVHQKLANAREMCEPCLHSFVKKLFSLETCNFLPSRLGMDVDDGDQILSSSLGEMLMVPLLRDVSPRANLCSCCSQLSKNKPYTFRLFQNKPTFKELICPDSPLSRTGQHARAHLTDGSSKARELIPTPLITNKPDRFSYFRYRQLKVTSESESEVPLSDDDDRSTNDRGSVNVKKEPVVPGLKSSSSPISDAQTKLSVISDDIVLEKFIHPEPMVSDASASCSKSQHHEDGFCDKSVTDSITYHHHSWKEKSNSLVSSEVICKPVPIKNSKEFSGVDVSRTSITHVEIKRGSDLNNLTSDSDKRGSDLNNVTSDSDNNLASSAKSAQSTPTSDVALVRESVRLREDLKRHLSQIPSPRWNQYPSTHPTQHARKDEMCKLFHSSSFHGVPSFNKRSNIELCSESADNVVSEVEGDVAVDRLLKKQIEMDQKSLSILSEELEEERNASAIAAIEAMAMINKLQEEKAAMQLEIMQFLRMMEEQTEYEQEAVRNLNDQLTEREKDIQDLEAELESFRKPSRDESAGKILPQSFDSNGSESEYSTTSTPHVLRPTRRKKHHRASVMVQDFPWSASCSTKENLLDLEDERLYISDCLKGLEKDVRPCSNTDASRHDEEDDEFNEECSADIAKRVKFQQVLTEGVRTRHSLCSQNLSEGNCVTHEMISSGKNLSPDTESLSLDANFFSCNLEAETPNRGHENHNRINSSCSNNKHLKTGKRNDIISLTDEVEHLNSRLEALEADRDFL